jgi:hypothetical protein
MKSSDPFGSACLSFLSGNRGEEINVFCNVTEPDIIPVDYLFRSFNEMPEIEQKALKLCKGKVLVVGAGAGCHSLWLQDHGFDVTSIDTSKGAVETMTKFGLVKVRLEDIYTYSPLEKFDTIISLMNGVGLAGDLTTLPRFLNKCMSLLNMEGQFIFDSTDLIYLIEEEDVEYSLNPNKYIGELEYQMSYESAETDWFKWLYIDKKRLMEVCEREGFILSALFEGGDYNTLYRLKK